MMAGRGRHSAAAGGPARHIPVMLSEVLAALEPKDGEIVVDGTFGAGGYSEAILEPADCKVIAIDRDPEAFRLAASLPSAIPAACWPCLAATATWRRSPPARASTSVDGVALDLGVSSMQLDEPERGFSFMQDGPLDMRMGQGGPSAGDVVNTFPERSSPRSSPCSARSGARAPSPRPSSRGAAEQPILTHRRACRHRRPGCSAASATRRSTPPPAPSRRSASM